MGTSKDPMINENWVELDPVTRAALAKQLEAMSEWNRSMSTYISEYQLNVLAAFRSSLANRWWRLWVLFATEGCLTLAVTVVSLLVVGLLVVLVLVAA
jgi:hypothetical protein